MTKTKQQKLFQENYKSNRENNCFYSEFNSETLLISKIWEFNRNILSHERIKDVQKFLKGDGIEESIRRNNYSVIEILEYIEDMCMAEVKETLERFEKNFEIYYERNGFDEISDEYMQQIATLKSVINTCQE